jgi:hypothetical protein
VEGKKPGKDIWDKLTSVSGLASGLAIALIGLYATKVYDQREKNRAAATAELQTVEKFFGHFNKDDGSEERTSAFELMSIFANPEIARKIAVAYGGVSAQSAIARISAEKSGIEKQSYDTTLVDLFRKFYDSKVFRIDTVWNPPVPNAVSASKYNKTCTGFLVSKDGEVLTSASCVAPEGVKREEFNISAVSNGPIETKDRAFCINADRGSDVALIRPDFIKQPVPVEGVQMDRNTDSVGILIGFDAADRIFAFSAKLTGRMSSDWAFGDKLPNSMVGSPIFNTQGRVIAMLVQRHPTGEFRALPIGAALRLLTPVSANTSVSRKGDGPCDEPLKTVTPPIIGN